MQGPCVTDNLKTLEKSYIFGNQKPEREAERRGVSRGQTTECYKQHLLRGRQYAKHFRYINSQAARYEIGLFCIPFFDEETEASIG